MDMDIEVKHGPEQITSLIMELSAWKRNRENGGYAVDPLVMAISMLAGYRQLVRDMENLSKWLGEVQLRAGQSLTGVHLDNPYKRSQDRDDRQPGVPAAPRVYRKKILMGPSPERSRARDYQRGGVVTPSEASRSIERVA